MYIYIYIFLCIILMTFLYCLIHLILFFLCALFFANIQKLPVSQQQKCQREGERDVREPSEIDIPCLASLLTMSTRTAVSIRSPIIRLYFRVIVHESSWPNISKQYLYIALLWPLYLVSLDTFSLWHVEPFVSPNEPIEHHQETKQLWKDWARNCEKKSRQASIPASWVLLAHAAERVNLLTDGTVSLFLVSSMGTVPIQVLPLSCKRPNWLAKERTDRGRTRISLSFSCHLSGVASLTSPSPPRSLPGIQNLEHEIGEMREDGLGIHSLPSSSPPTPWRGCERAARDRERAGKKKTVDWKPVTPKKQVGVPQRGWKEPSAVHQKENRYTTHNLLRLLGHKQASPLKCHLLETKVKLSNWPNRCCWPEGEL